MTAEFRQCHPQGRVEVMNRDVWVENDQHPPKVEEQVREIAYKDAEAMTAALSQRDVTVTTDELETTMSHVELRRQRPL